MITTTHWRRRGPRQRLLLRFLLGSGAGGGGGRLRRAVCQWWVVLVAMGGWFQLVEALSNCPAGQDDSVAAGTCAPCAAGKFKAAAGTDACAACAVGTYGQCISAVVSYSCSSSCAVSLGAYNMSPWSGGSFPDTTASWVWSYAGASSGSNTGSATFSKKIYIGPCHTCFNSASSASVKIYYMVDDQATVSVNGVTVDSTTTGVWSGTGRSVDAVMNVGFNTISVDATSTGGGAGLMVAIFCKTSVLIDHTDASWCIGATCASSTPSINGQSASAVMTSATACVACPANSWSAAGARTCTANAGYFGPVVRLFDGVSSSYSNLGSDMTETVNVVGTAPAYSTLSSRLAPLFDSSAAGGYLTVVNKYSDMTVMFWLYISVLPGAGVYYQPFCLRSDATATGGTGGNFDINPTGSINNYVFYGSNAANYPSSTTMAAAAWNHVAFTIPTASPYKSTTYINGAKVNNPVSQAAANLVNFQTIMLGADITSSPNRLFKGALQDFRVYNYVFSDAQIASIYNSGSVQSPYTSCSPSCSATTYGRCTPTGTALCCGAGTYFVEGYSTECTPCPPGTYGFGNTTTCTPCAAGLNSPAGASACAAQYPVYALVADQAGGTLRKVDASSGGTIPMATSLNAPSGVAVSPLGDFALITTSTTPHKVLKLNMAALTTSVLAGSGTAGAADGVGTAATLNGPMEIRISPDATYALVVEMNTHSLRKISLLDSTVTRIAGSGTTTAGYAEGSGTSIAFNVPAGLDISSDGSFALVTEWTGNRIRKITLTGGVVSSSLIAGGAAAVNGASGSVDGAGSSATFTNPQGIVISSDMSFALVVDRGNNKIRKVMLSAPYTVSPLATIASSSPVSIAWGALEDLVFVTGSTTHKVYQVTYPGGVVTTLSGTGTAAEVDNSVGSSAQFNTPFAITTWKCSIKGYGMSTTSASCAQCPAGKYGSGNGLCTPCAAGTYSTGVGIRSQAECLTCAANTYSNAGATACSACSGVSANLWSGTGAGKCTANQGYYDLGSSLLAYYPYNSDNFLADISGNMGSLVASSSAPTPQASGPAVGLTNSAVLAGGSSQHFTLPAFTAPADMSVCAWFYISSGVTRNWNRVIDMQSATVGQENFVVGIQSNSNDFVVSLNAGGTDLGYSSVTDGAKNTNTWIHFCVAISGTSVKIWLNGVLNSFTRSASRTNNMRYITNYIGKSAYAADAYWYGAFDEHRLYSRALTATEVAAIYAFRGDTNTAVMPLSCTVAGCSAPSAARCLSSGSGICCAAGTYFVEGTSTSCLPCPAGTYSTTGGQTACTKCSSNTAYSTSATAASCVACAAGSGGVGGVCAVTNPGTCPAGTFNSGGTCFACVAGKYSATAGAASCTDCGTGASSAAGSSACYALAGYYKDVSGVITQCPANTGSSAGAAGCVPAVGNYLAQGTALLSSAMSASTAGATTSTQTIGGESVTVTTSSVYSASSVSGLFDGSSSDWSPSGARYSTGGDGSYTANTFATLVDGVSYSGEWVQIGFQTARQLGVYSLTAQSGGTYYKRAPANFIIAGSSNNGAWTMIDIQTSIAWTTSAQVQSFSPSPSIYRKFTTFRLIIRVTAGATDGYTSIGEWTLYTGTPTTCTSATCAYPAPYSQCTTTGSAVCCGSGTYWVPSPNAAGCTPCPLGTYGDGSSTSCTSCAAGTFSGFTGASACQACSTGLTSDAGSAVCVANAVGQAAPLGQYYNATQGSYVACPPGYTCAGGAAQPLACPVGSWCTTNTSIPCTNCAAGQYIATACTTTADATCSPCASGTYATVSNLASAGLCTQCVAGTYSSGTGIAASSQCVMCNAGTYSTVPGASAAAQCTACGAGTYSTASGAPVASSCVQCVGGTYSAGTGVSSSSQCSLCGAGTYSSVLGAISNATCANCAAGTYSSSSGLPASGQCTLCGAGAYSTALGATVVSTCTSCSAGAYSTGSGMPVASACQACTDCVAGQKISTACSATTNRVCASCTAGADYTTALNQASCAACSLCTSGQSRTTACTVSSNTVCTPCPAGNYCPSTTASTVTACTANNYCLANVASPSPCTTCNAGNYISTNCSSSVNTVCSGCLTGNTYSTTSSALSCTTCSACVSGQYTVSSCIVSANVVCQQCPAGSYCANPATGITGTCVGGSSYCLAGSVSTSSCSVCSAGTYRSSVCTTIANTVCSPCVALTSFSTTSNAASCTACGTCSDGQYVSSFCTVSSNTVCAGCPQGSYCPNKATATVTACASTYYCPPNSMSQVKCLAGYYCPNTYTQTLCTTGDYCPTGSTAKTQCATGYYCPNTTSQIACTGYCPPGSTAQNPCPPGFYCSDALSKYPCDLGNYCPTGTVSQSLCAAGSYCTNTSVQTACSSGYFCPAGSTSQTICALGSYCSTTSSQQACSQGYYCPAGTVTPQLCPAGYACATPNVSAACDVYAYGVIGKFPPKQFNSVSDETVVTFLGQSVYREDIILNSTGISYGVGVYSIYYSSKNAANLYVLGDALFDSTPGSYGSIYHMMSPQYSSGTYVGSNYIVNGYGGDWIVVKFPNPIVLTGYGFKLENSFWSSGPASYKIYGSNDGTSFTEISQASKALTWSDVYNSGQNLYNTTITPASAEYMYIGMAINKQYSGAGLNNIQMHELWFYGKEKTAAVAAQGQATSCLAGTTASVLCPLGSYCPISSTVTPCTSSNYCAAGSPSQTICPSGNFCPNPSTKTLCNSTYYCPAGSISQTICAAGSYCTNTSTQTACTSGNYCPAGSLAQTPCALGSYCPNTSTQILCTQGNYCPASSTSQTPCPAGSYCATPSQIATCTAGNYCPPSSTSQTACALGSYCTNTSSQIACSSTYYCPSSSTSQTKCLIGSYCATPSSQVACNSTYYCPQGSTAQTKCLVGSVCTTPSTQTACASGSWCPTGTVTESACPLGSYCTTPSSSVACVAPNFCDIGSTQQLACPAGYFCPDPSTKTPCSANKYCLSGVTAGANCSVCSNGQYVASVCSASANIVCPACTNLPAHATYTGVGTVVSDCPWICDLGYYLSGGQCLACPPGSWCAANIQNTCPTNANSTALSSTQNSCLCMAGYAGDGSKTGTSPCPVCRAGFYCPGGNTNISTACPGNFSSPIGSSSYSSCQCIPGFLRVGETCQLCGAGQICISGQLSTCPTNSLAPGGSSSASDCVCNPGFYGQNGFPCTQCPANSYCPGGNVITSCTANAVSPAQSTNATACYCDRGYQGVANAACSPCAANTWCWTGVLNQCPDNTVSPPLSSWWNNCTCIPGYTGADGSACTACAAGSYKTANGSASCTNCPLNNYCPMAAVTPTPCPIAHSNSPLGSLSSSQCVCDAGYFGASCGLCTVAYFCPGGPNATRCPNDGYTAAGATSASNCLCPANSAVVSTTCTCSPGYERITDAASPAGWRCDPCGADHYCVAGVSMACPLLSTAPAYSNSSAACQCGDGYYMSGGACVKCGYGLYSKKGAVGACSVCPSNSNTSSIGSTALAQCMCLPGFVGDATVLSQTMPIDLVKSCNGLVCPTNAYSTFGGWLVQSAVDGTAVTTWHSGGSDPATGFNWWRIDFQTQRYVSRGTVWNGAGNTDRLDRFQIWVGDDTSFPGTNRLAYYSPNVGISSEKYTANALGRYLYVAGNATTYLRIGEIEILSDESRACGVCYKDQYCPGGQVNYTIACPNSQYSLVGSSSVSQCGCPTSAALLLDLNCTCNNGTYRVADATAPLGGWRCDACPATKYCQLGNAVACPAGYSCPANTVNPVICPLGSYCAASVSAPVACPAGTYAPTTGTASLSGCLPCGYGYYSTAAGSSVCAACQINTNTTVTNANAASQCVCDPGYYMSGGVCVLCGYGTYSARGAVGSCTACPANSNTSALGSVGYSQCICTAGYAGEITSASSTGCQPCVANSYCPGAQVNYVVACPNSAYSLVGASSASQCGCPASATLLPSLNCTCNNGTYKVLNAAAPLGGWQCDACPATKYCQLGSAIACPAGYSCPANTVYPVICPRGSYCLASSAAPTPCPPGTYAANTGTASLAGCLPCGYGRYATAAGSSVCDVCPVHTNTTVANANLATQCVCDPGYFMSGGGCVKCDYGTYSAQGAVAACTLCPANSNTTALGASVFGQCLCVAGYAGEITSASDGAGCKPCVVNAYCPGAQVNHTVACPNSTFSYAGAASASQCMCPADAVVRSGACVCKDGFYKVMNPASLLSGWQCDACPAGSNCLNGVQSSCPAGYYCSPQSVEPLICPVGAYCLQSVSQPTLCPAGTYNAHTGATTEAEGCIPCGNGYYSTAPGSTQCAVCQANSNTTVLNAQAQSQCVCNAGYAMVAGVCTQCGYATYSAQGASDACTPCPAHSNTTARGSTDASQCICGVGYKVNAAGSCDDCPADSYCPGAGLSTPCPTNLYSLAGSVDITQCRCPANSVLTAASGCVCNNGYSRKTNAAAPLAGWECVTCAAGSLCINGTVAPCAAGYSCANGAASVCPANRYCPEGIAAPLACPNNAHSAAGSSSCTCDDGYLSSVLQGAHFFPLSAESDLAQLNLVDAGDITYITDPSLCRIGKCLLNTNSADKYHASLSTSVFPTGAAPVFTLAFWMNLQTANPWRGLVEIRGANFLGTADYMELFSMNTLTDAETQGPGAAAFNEHSAFFELNAWHHVAITFSHGYYTLYRDGASIFSKQGLWSEGAITVLLLNQNAYFDEIYFVASELLPSDIATLYASNSICGPCGANGYCAGGASFSCPVGAVSPPASTSVSACACAAGFYSVSGVCVQCPAGRFCSGGSVSASSSSGPCPAGSYCLAGVTSPVPCSTTDGSHCPAGSFAPDICPSGYYCPTPASDPIPCPAGGFCPRGSLAPRPCPGGSYSTATLQTTVATCIPCTTCTLGAFESAVCNATQNRVCATCSNKPQRATFLTANAACAWVCDSGYYGDTCAPCAAGFWCKSGIANRCPTDSTSPALSSTQNACMCNPGYSSQGTASGTSPCALCQAGSVCPGAGIVSVEVQAAPIANVTTQLMLVQQPLPVADNLVSLFVSIPASVAAMRDLLPPDQAGIPIFTRQVCRGSYCALCDGTEQCVNKAVVGVRRGLNGKYAFNVTSLKADTLYEFVVVIPDMCVPTISIDPEYVTGTKVAIASISTIQSATVVCLTDSFANTQIPVTGTAAPSAFGTARRLLESAKRRLLQQTSDTLAVSLVVPTTETAIIQAAVVSEGVTVEGFTAIAESTGAVTVEPPLSCPENATSPEGSTSLKQCVCKPGYQGNASTGTPCAPCPPNTFCSGGIIGLCAANALAPAMSDSVDDCACVPGYYGSPLACQQCPANSYCPGGLTASKCTSNAVSPAQSTSGDACYCLPGFAGTKNAPCTLCPPGSWCWTGVANTCPLHSTTPAGSSRASDCACVDGFRTQISTDLQGLVTKTCLQCAANTYCKDGVLNQCPQYSTSPAESSLITQCACQSDSALDNGACMCRIGYVRGRPGAVDQCTPCPAGSWCPEQTTVRACTDNAISLPGSFNAGNCSLCADGWLKNGPLSCRRCLAGYACPDLNTEYVCTSGSYAPALATACVTCSAGSYASVNASTSCTPCAANSNSGAGATDEAQCVCSDGYYKLGLTKTCAVCPAGSSCSANNIQQCPVGTSSAAGQSACASCAQGKYQSTIGSASCAPCPAGANVVVVSSMTELNAPIDRELTKTASGKLYVMRTFFEVSQGKNLTKWSFFAKDPGCAITPMVFSSPNAGADLSVPNTVYNLAAVGAKRNVTSGGAYTFSFYADPAQGYLVGANNFFGWVFDDAACIPYEVPTLAVGQASTPVMEFTNLGGQSYTKPDIVYGDNERWSVQVTSELTQVLPSTTGTGTTSVADCRCPSSTKKLSPSGICQPRCPDGQYMVKDTDTVCSPCKQGSYCVDSTIYPCAAGLSSLSGASVCTPCIVPGIASDIALYTCGLKTCTVKASQPLGTSSWRGLGKLNVGVNQFGSLDDFPFTPWAPGSIVVGMELNPASDRPYALLERDVIVVAGKPNAFQFRFRCAGMACVRSFVVEYKESGGPYTTIFSVESIPSSGWVQTSTEFFTPTSGFATVRFVAQLQLSSSKVWLASVETVGMGIWQLDGTSSVRLLNTTTVPIAYSTAYTELDEVSTIQLQDTGLVYNVPQTTVYPGRTFPGSVIYIVSVFAYGQGTLAFEVEDVNGVLPSVSSSSSSRRNVWPVASSAFAKYVLQLDRAPTKVTFRATGTIVLASPSLTLRDQIIGCQSCLANYHCSGQTINACPSNSVSAPGSDQQIDCFCDKGFYGNVNFTVGWSPCSPCPANYYCDGSQAGNHLAFCPNGTKSNLSSWFCSPCQIDEYCAFGHVGACPDHSTSPISSWDVTQCICDDGYYGTAPDCKPCEPGFYCTGGKRIACTGNATSTPKSDDPTDCFCDRGFYGVQNAPCKACEEASWCWNGIKNACPINMWSPVRSSYQSNCTCTDGSYPSGASCVLCSSGTYKAGKGQVGCIPCPAGTSSMAVGAVDASTCTPCEPGKYSVTPGQYQCQECAAGYYQPGQGSTSCRECWVGSYSLGKAAICTGCAAGSASPVVAAATSSVCQMCDAGWWSPGNVSTCTMCGVCSYWKYPATVVFQPQTLKAVLTQNQQKFQFAPDSVSGGMFMAMGTSVYYVDLRTGIVSQPVSIQFPGRSWWFASLTTSNLGGYLYGVQDRYAFRVDLNMGSWDKNYAAVLPSCIVEDTSRPVAVVWIGQPSGVLGMDPVQESVVLHNFAIAGTNYVCLSPTDSDFMYVTGTFGLRKVSKSTGNFTNLLTGTAYTVCHVTPDGIFVILSQATTKTVWSYSLFDAALVKVASNALVSGMYVDGQNLVLGVDAVGVRNISYTEADSRTCSPGKYSGASGLVSESQCTACEPGRLCPGGSNRTACVPGTFSPETGLRQQEQCVVCPAGYYCPGAEVKTVCPLGSFSPATRLVQASDCPLCSENYYCPNTTSQLRCPDNTVSLAGSHDLSECTCMPGYRCIIAKVVHAEIVLQMTESQFTETVRAKYLAAIAASAGVDVSKVTIVSVQQVSVTGAGGLRRLLTFGNTALEVHTSIYEAPTESLSDLNGHLNRQGLPSYHEVRIFVQNEVVDSVRLGR